MTREQIQAFAEFQGVEELLLCDGFEDAFVGITWQFTNACACYDRARCIQILMARDCMSMEEAEEYFEFNVIGSYVGTDTPTFLIPFTE